jgi:hypothetical protein
MDLIAQRIIETILFNDCRYAEIYLEEFGRGEKSDFSYFKLLIKSFDAGFDEENSLLMMKDILSLAVRNLKFITFNFESNTKYEYLNDSLISQKISKPKEYGTSLSFEFSSFSSFPQSLHSFVISNNYPDLGTFVLRIKSCFQDLSYLDIIASDISEPDFISIILGSIEEVISQSANIQQSLSTF